MLSPLGLVFCIHTIPITILDFMKESEQTLYHEINNIRKTTLGLCISESTFICSTESNFDLYHF